MIRVAVVDDDALVRLGLSAVLGAEPDIEVAGEAGDGADVPDLVARTRPDVVLMDVRMPRIDGIAATATLTARPDPPAVVVITTFEHDASVYEALRAGARGFVLKRARPDELLRVIRTVAATDALVFPEAIRELAARSAPADPRRAAWADRCTPRELDVLELLARGHSNAEIADGLFIGVETVKSHVKSLLDKAGARDRTALVVAAYDAGVVRPRGW